MPKDLFFHIIKPLNKMVNLSTIGYVDAISQGVKPPSKNSRHSFKFVVGVTSFNFNSFIYSFIAVLVAVVEDKTD